jgi:hypothetical protein
MHGRWGERETTPGFFVVYVPDALAEKEAMAYLCSTNKYVCVVEPAGRLIEIQRTRK